MMADEERFKRIEEAALLMKELVLRHEERLDGHDERMIDFYRAIKESREDFEFKLNALIDAQIRNEAEIEKLNKASQSQLKRIEELEDK